PEPERDALANGQCDSLLVVPDGPLALLPFETLVVQSGENPQYLLDNGPPILYGPSLSVLFNLAARPVVPVGTRKPVLTVADPVYAQVTTPSDTTRAAGKTPQPPSRSRYAGLGGRLAPLPFTGAESQAVAAAFTSAGTATGKLEREQATEDIV